MLILRDVKCPECGLKDEIICEPDDKAYCAECAVEMLNLISTPKIATFQAGLWRDIAEEPIYIESRKQLREECEKHGKISEYADMYK